MKDQVDVLMRAMGSTGQWAGEQFLRAMERGETISPSHLRTNAVLSNDQWVEFDTVLVREASIRMRAAGDLIAAGLTRTITNGLAKTVFEYQKIGDMDPAVVSMDGVTRSENDRLAYTDARIPMPITHKDWYLNLRQLMASRTSGEAIDTTHIEAAGRKIGEEIERMVLVGGKTFQGLPIYGYTTFPARNTASFGTNGQWGAAAKTGDNILADISTMIAAQAADRFYGPFVIYIGSGMAGKMNEDFKANSDKTIRQRILELEEIQAIRVVDQLPASTVIMVQLTSDVVQLIQGEPLQTVQWDIHGGFQINYKGFTIQIPLLRSDASGRAGLFHMS